jgi:hypothetical protein
MATPAPKTGKTSPKTKKTGIIRKQKPGNSRAAMMKFDFSKEGIILFVTKVISYVINAVIIALGLGIVAGGVYLLYRAITTPV